MEVKETCVYLPSPPPSALFVVSPEGQEKRCFPKSFSKDFNQKKKVLDLIRLKTKTSEHDYKEEFYIHSPSNPTSVHLQLPDTAFFLQHSSKAAHCHSALGLHSKAEAAHIFTGTQNTVTTEFVPNLCCEQHYVCVFIFDRLLLFCVQAAQ